MQHVPELPFSYRYLDDIIESRYISENTIMRVLANFAYRDETNLLVFPVAAATTAGLAFLTMAVQAWSTIQRNPVHALRDE